MDCTFTYKWSLQSAGARSGLNNWNLPRRLYIADAYGGKGPEGLRVSELHQTPYGLMFKLEWFSADFLIFYATWSLLISTKKKINGQNSSPGFMKTNPSVYPLSMCTIYLSLSTLFTEETVSMKPGVWIENKDICITK